MMLVTVPRGTQTGGPMLWDRIRAVNCRGWLAIFPSPQFPGRRIHGSQAPDGDIAVIEAEIFHVDQAVGAVRAHGRDLVGGRAGAARQRVVRRVAREDRIIRRPAAGLSSCCRMLKIGGLLPFKPRAHWRIQPIHKMRQLVSGGKLLRSLYGDEGGTGSRFHHGQPETSALGGRI